MIFFYHFRSKNDDQDYDRVSRFKSSGSEEKFFPTGNQMRKDRPQEYASPACLMHEVDPAYMGLAPATQSLTEWRRAERRRLIDERTAISSTERERRTSRIVIHLDQLLLPDISGKSVSVYWPFLGEPDLRGWMAAVESLGATCLLPAVVEKATPLRFRTWEAGEPLERGVLNIPVPAEGVERQPDIVIAPVVGFDADCYRLGFGGGYFDRTLAVLEPKPLIIGVGFEFQKIPTITPQPHDIPMDAIVTDANIRVRQGSRLSILHLPEAKE